MLSKAGITSTLQLWKSIIDYSHSVILSDVSAHKVNTASLDTSKLDKIEGLGS